MNQRHSLVAGTTDGIPVRAWQSVGLHAVDAPFCLSSSCSEMRRGSAGVCAQSRCPGCGGGILYEPPVLQIQQ